MVAETNPVLAEAWGVVKTLNADERARLIAESREKAQMDLRSMIGNATREGLEKGLQTGLQQGRVEGLQTGLQQGRFEGIQFEKQEVARSLLQVGMPLSDIAQVTQLSLDDIERLRDEPKH